jgi:hypothetical protein
MFVTQAGGVDKSIHEIVAFHPGLCAEPSDVKLNVKLTFPGFNVPATNGPGSAILLVKVPMINAGSAVGASYTINSSKLFSKLNSLNETAIVEFGVLGVRVCVKSSLFA